MVIASVHVWAEAIEAYITENGVGLGSEAILSCQKQSPKTKL